MFIPKFLAGNFQKVKRGFMASRKKTKLINFYFDSPLVLVFAFIAIFIMILNSIAMKRGQFGLINFFSAPASIYAKNCAFNFKNVVHYLRLFLHVLGHTQWTVLVRDLSFILLLGPLLEKTYGTKLLLLMFAVCAFASGVLNVCFVDSMLCGSSGIAFMMILLTAFMNIKKQTVPVSFVLLLFLYIGLSLSKSGGGNAEIVHLAGGIFGSLFGMIPPVKNTSKKAAFQKQPDAGETAEKS